MGILSPFEIAALLLVFLLLFGAKRLPGAARALGESIRELRASVRAADPRPELERLKDEP